MASLRPAYPVSEQPAAQTPTSSLREIFSFKGFAGTTKGSFFAAPGWVDESKPPGHTSQKSYGKSPDWWLSAYSGYSLFFSPNLVWLGCALLVYFLAPYDLAAAADGFAWEWISKRAVVNATFTFGYVGFWHVSLYWLGFGTRPFMPNRTYNWAKVAHNAFYTLLATVQWTAWEALAMRAWATGRLPYLPDALAFGTWSGLANFVASCFWVPLFRSWHFYFAHRGLHIRPLYKYVHSLHHRNTDIEPFAGLCMHPIEHLYYFSCAGLCLYLFASPFAFLWNGVHLLLSPAASHSGYEDNFQSDQFHYLHHKFFECNYGPSDCPLDRWFGTFRDKLDARRAPSNAATAKTSDERAVVTDAKATLIGLPEPSYLSYLALAACAPWLLLAHTLTQPASAVGSSAAHLAASAVALGPVAAAVLLVLLTEPAKVAADPKAALAAPFHKERLFGALGLHLLVGGLLTAMPVYHLVHTAVAPPGEAAYCSLRGGC